MLCSNKLKTIQIFSHKHKDIITCVAVHQFNQLLVTGSRDGSVLVFKFKSISSNNVTFENDDKPIAFLYGNNNIIRCLEINEILNVLISCDGKGLVIYDITKCSYLRSIHIEKSAHILRISNSGYFIYFIYFLFIFLFYLFYLFLFIFILFIFIYFYLFLFIFIYFYLFLFIFVSKILFFRCDCGIFFG